MEQTLRWSLAPKRDDHIPRAASHASATVDARQLGASRPQQRAHGSNKCLCPWPANASVSVPDSHTSTDSCDQRTATSAFVPLSVGTGPSPVASACLPAARSWRNFPRNWRKQDMDTTRILPGCAPSGRPIERTVPHLLIDSRPGPKSGAGCRLTTLLTLLHCQVSRSVRVPALSVGAGEGNSLAYQRRLQVPKLNGVQVTDGKQELTHKWNGCVKRSFMRACNRAIRHGQAQPLYLCTFRFLQIPEECLAADHRCLALAVHCTGASRALEPHGQVPLRIAANLRPTQLVKRMVQNFKQEVAAAETPLAHTLWACRPPPAGTLAHCPADTSLYWVLAKMMAARETNSAPIHSSNRVQNLIKVQSQDVFRCTKV